VTGYERPMIYVVQKHRATSLHYDFRLEVDGALASWAVPKGPSLDPKNRRLAMRVEDHAMDYAMFEGRIPRGEYGAGGVIVWDHGTYENLRDVSMAEALDDGYLSIRLDGSKLKGEWSVRRMHGVEREQWLLKKRDDEFAMSGSDITSERPESVVSGLTIEAVTS